MGVCVVCFSSGMCVVFVWCFFPIEVVVWSPFEFVRVFFSSPGCVKLCCCTMKLLCPAQIFGELNPIAFTMLFKLPSAPFYSLLIALYAHSPDTFSSDSPNLFFQPLSSLL